MKLTHKLYYCKARKKTGKPIVKLNVKTGKETYTNKINLNNVCIRMSFNNSTGRIKSRDATTILEVWKNE